MSIVASSPPSSSALEDLSTQLQHASPKQTGTLIIDHSGAVLAASGDCKETADRLATCMLTLMRDTNGVFVHSRPTNAKAKEELARMTSQTHTHRGRTRARERTRARRHTQAIDVLCLTCPLWPRLSSFFVCFFPVAFKTYQYAISLTQDLVICVKSNLD